MPKKSTKRPHVGPVAKEHANYGRKCARNCPEMREPAKVEPEVKYMLPHYAKSPDHAAPAPQFMQEHYGRECDSNCAGTVTSVGLQE